jgi:hypothetical protein
MSLIGIINLDKLHDWATRECIYLKRGVREDHSGHLQLIDYVQLPSLIFFLPNHTLSRYREQSFTDAEIRMFCAASIKGFFSSASKLSSTLSEEELVSLQEFAKWYYMALDLPMEGHVPGTDAPPGLRNVYRKFFIPPPEFIGSSSYVQDSILARYSGSYVYRGISVDDTVFFYGDIRCYACFYSRPTPELRYLERMGVIQKGVVDVERLEGPMGYQKMVERWTASAKDRRTPLMYKYMFVQECPGLYPGLYNQDMFVPDDAVMSLVVVRDHFGRYSGKR